MLRITISARHTVLTVDPSVRSLGWAAWPMTQWRSKYGPSACGLIHPLLKGRFEDRLRSVAQQFGEVAIKQNVQICLIEMPVFYANDPGGHMAAASGDLLKLCATVGALLSQLPPHARAFLVKVPDWKGQLPKKNINDRILKVLGPTICAPFKDDIWDAVGIALWAKGYINKDIQRKEDYGI